MNEIRKQVLKKAIISLLTTPCFEFWLLLHLVDVKKQYKGDMQKFRDNEKRTNKYTFTSLQVSEYAGHSKKSVKKFLDNIILIILIMQFHRLKNFSLQM